MLRQVRMLTAQTTNTTAGPFSLHGTYVLTIKGTFGAASVRVYHRYAERLGTLPGAENNMPQDTDLVFSAPPSPIPLICVQNLYLYVEVTGADGSTNIDAVAIQSS